MFYSILIGIILVLFGGLNYYVGLRGWQFLGSGIHFLSIKVYWIIFGAVVLSGIIGIAANKFLPDFLRSSFYIIGSYWLVALTYFMLSIVIIDLFRLLDRWIGFLPRAIKNNSAFSFSLGLVIIVFVTILMVYGTWNAKNLKVTSYDITIPKKVNSLKQLRIVMISDTHFGYINDKRQKKMVDTINGLNPDVVLIPGDITEDIVLFEKCGIASDFQKIKSKYGVYASFGNHDYSSEDLTLITNQLNKAGINLLRDSSAKVGDSFYIIGREDKSYEMISGKKRMELSKLMKGIDRELPVILLDHQPVNIEEAESTGIDLQLSGHTHKGQFFPFNFITNRIFTIDYGYLKTGNLQVIVSSGAGTWGPPIRIGSSSEVVNIVMRFQ